jgi:hypothetical protein
MKNIEKLAKKIAIPSLIVLSSLFGCKKEEVLRDCEINNYGSVTFYYKTLSWSHATFFIDGEGIGYQQGGAGNYSFPVEEVSAGAHHYRVTMGDGYSNPVEGDFNVNQCDETIVNF